MKSCTEKDIWLPCIIIAKLGLTVVLSTIGTIALAMARPSTPKAIAASGSAATGGLWLPRP